jgi:hypothetical protein
MNFRIGLLTGTCLTNCRNRRLSRRCSTAIYSSSDKSDWIEYICYVHELQAGCKLLTYSNYITIDFDNHRITTAGKKYLDFECTILLSFHLRICNLRQFVIFYDITVFQGRGFLQIISMYQQSANI